MPAKTGHGNVVMQ